MKKIILLYALLVLHFHSKAQVFSPLGQGLNDNVRALCADTVNNLIYAGGNFMASGTVPLYRIAVWDGVSWDSLSSGTDANVLGLAMYQGNLIAGGPFYQMGGLSANGVASWNGAQWQNIGDITGGGSGAVYGVKVIDNEFYAFGAFDSVNGLPSSKVAKWDGNTWFTYPVLDNYGGGFSIRAGTKFNGDLYVGGNFDSQLATNMKDIAKWNGSAWLPVSNGLTGAMTEVDAFAVFQGELYVGGYFFTASGDPGNCILKWNGSNWTQLGLGLNHYVADMIVYNNELYVCGAFTLAGGIPVHNIAKWDGLNWHEIPNADIDIVAISMTQLNNELYIGGVFWDIDGQLINNIVKYNPTVGFSELKPKSFAVYPTPAINDLTISMEAAGKCYLKIFDLSGKTVFEATLKNKKNTIDVSSIASGMYVLQLIQNNKLFSQKISVNHN